MIVRQANIIYADGLLDDMFGAWSVVPGAALIATPKLRLSKDPSLAITQATVLADLTAHEADYTGYTGGGYTPVFTGPVQQAATQRALLVNKLFTVTGASPGNNISGGWIDNGTLWRIGFVFADQVDMTASGNYFDLLLILSLDDIQAAIGQ